MFKNIVFELREYSMRYRKEHKEATRQRILASAHRLFTARGFVGTSIEMIMRECKLTRGGFYAHFRSKSELYREALKLTAHRATPSTSEGGWIDAMLNEYLDAEHAGDEHNRFAFFVTDVASNDPEVRTAYGSAFKAMSDKIMGRMAGQFGCSEEAVLATASMLIGAAAIARSVDDDALKAKVLAACKSTARALIENKNILSPPAFFWENRSLALG